MLSPDSFLEQAVGEAKTNIDAEILRVRSVVRTDRLTRFEAVVIANPYATLDSSCHRKQHTGLRSNRELPVRPEQGLRMRTDLL